MPSRLPNVSTTIFTIMSGLSQQYGAINLGQGFPSFQPDPVLQNLIYEAMKNGHNQYAPMVGLLALREAIATKNQFCYGANIDPLTEITVCSGGTEALFAAIAACIGEAGDEIILLQPCYDSYAPAILLNGGIPRYSNLTYPDFRPDWDHIISLINPKTKAIIINTPHNPTGTIWPLEDVLKLQEIANQYKLFVIADEVYEHIVFEGKQHHSLLAFPDLRERSFIIHSFGKTFHATGYKIGYAIAPPALTKELRKVHQYLTFSTFTPIQFALATYLSEPANYQGLSEMYEEKRNQLLEAFSLLPLKPMPCYGTYFQLYSFEGLESLLSDQEFARLLVKEAKVASIPVSSFYQDGTDHKLLRFCFAKDQTMLEQASTQLQSFFS